MDTCFNICISPTLPLHSRFFSPGQVCSRLPPCHALGLRERGNAWSLNVSQCVEGRRWYASAREGLEETHVFAGDEPCHGEERRRASTRIDARQSVIN
jgi:hypothetical protein